MTRRDSAIPVGVLGIAVGVLLSWPLGVALVLIALLLLVI